MVRYSKLPFRQLVSLYDTHITHTPMMLCVPSSYSVPTNPDQHFCNSAKEFSRSAFARDSDFSTNSRERGTFYMADSLPTSRPEEWDLSPEARASTTRRARKIRGSMLVQFAANDGVQLADAAELIKPWVDGIDLNCGLSSSSSFTLWLADLSCPQVVHKNGRTTKGSGVPFCASPKRCGISFERRSSALGGTSPCLSRSASIQTYRASSPSFFVPPPLAAANATFSLTNTLVNTAIEAGADIITVHGRTRLQSSSGHPVNLDAIAFAVSCGKGRVPMVANGDVFTKAEAEETRRRCGVRGVMSARGLLANPVGGSRRTWGGEAELESRRLCSRGTTRRR